jgi:hypothetical protein
LLPEIVLAAGLGWFLIDEPDAATSAFRSGRAVLLAAAATLAWIVGRVLLARFVPWRTVRAAAFGVAAIGALAIVVVPAYDDDTVVEAFPTAPSTAAEGHDAATIAPPTMPVRSPATSLAAEPMRLRTGSFVGIDHRATGTVSIYRAPGGHLVVGLEEFDIQPGPDYDVYVVPGADRDDRDGGTRLDDLRGNQGTQFYEVPADVALGDGEWTVLIWCATFGVPVARATPL